jgi:hypothetical protein
MKYLKAIAVTAAFMIILSGCESPNQPPTDQLQSAASDELSLAKKGNNNGNGVNSKFECTDVAPLMTGKNERTGTVTVTNDGSTLYVSYSVTGGWTLTKTHLNISRGIFTRHDGSGRVNVKQNHASGTTTYTYEIPMQWSAGSKVYIKAHADVKKNKTNDVAYGGKNGKKQKGHWFAFFRYMIKGTPPAAYDISGITYIDENSNGEQDEDEEGLSGVSLSLSNGMTTVSDANGEYTFTALSNGTYTVTAAAVDGYTNTTPLSASVTIAGANQDVDFGYLASIAPPMTYTVSGYVFVDDNTNGVPDDGEERLSGVVVTLSGGATVSADEFGAYAFSGLTDGSYTVSVPNQKSFAPITPLTQHVTIAGSDQTADFRFRILSLSVSGIVFNDDNENGVRDDGETGIAGGTVYLYSGSVFLVTVSDANGNYIFDNLTADTYFLDFYIEGYQMTTPLENTENIEVVSESVSLDFGFIQDSAGG